MFSKLSAFFLLVTVSCIFADPRFRTCTERPSNAEIKSVSVEGCKREVAYCPAERGKSIGLEFKFTPKEPIRNPEYLINGLLEPDKNDKPLEAPFLSHISLCKNLTISESECKATGLEANKQYEMKLLVPLLPAYPKIKVDVRIVIREKSKKKLNRKQRANWKLHPGKISSCIIVPLDLI